MAQAYAEVLRERVMSINNNQLHHWIGRIRNIAAECFDLHAAERLRILSEELEGADRTASEGAESQSPARKNYA
jgi:hypothetical protein